MNIKEEIKNLNTDEIAFVGEQIGTGFNPAISTFDTEAIYIESKKIIEKFLKEPKASQIKILKLVKKRR